MNTAKGHTASTLTDPKHDVVVALSSTQPHFHTPPNTLKDHDDVARQATNHGSASAPECRGDTCADSKARCDCWYLYEFEYCCREWGAGLDWTLTGLHVTTSPQSTTPALIVFSSSPYACPSQDPKSRSEVQREDANIKLATHLNSFNVAHVYAFVYVTCYTIYPVPTRWAWLLCFYDHLMCFVPQIIYIYIQYIH